MKSLQKPLLGLLLTGSLLLAGCNAEKDPQRAPGDTGSGGGGRGGGGTGGSTGGTR